MIKSLFSVKTIILSILILGTCSIAFAQNRSEEPSTQLNKRELRKIQKYQLLRNEESGDLEYDHEFNVGGRLMTNGWSAYLEYEKRSSEVSSLLFQLEFGEVKHPKEDKQAKGRDAYGFRYSGHPFVYGKQNIFYQARLGIGQRRVIGGKGNKNGVEVSGLYMGGLSLGLVKPYYLELQSSQGGGSSYQKYSEANAADFLNVQNILGGPGLGRGWNEVDFVPGLYGRIGARFDWAEFNQFVSAVEVGLTGSFYSKKIEIMVQNPGDQFFYGAYVSLLFGKRW